MQNVVREIHLITQQLERRECPSIGRHCEAGKEGGREGRGGHGSAVGGRWIGGGQAVNWRVGIGFGI